jgi:hypothetical protein
MAEWIKVNGDITTVEPKNGTDFKLDELQKYVDGRIEIVPTKDGRIIVLDEEGKLKDKDANIKATDLFGRHDYIVGDVLVCDDGEVE